jgi:ADP-ribosylglycohydrolase
MTTPGSHNDTYAESYHRQFFANYDRGIPPERCAGTENHDTASIGALVALPPVIVAASCTHDPSTVDAALLAHLRLTHHSAKLERYALALGRLLPGLLRETRARIIPIVSATAQSLGFPVTKVVERVRRDQLSDLHVIGNILSPACYIDQSFPAVLYLLACYEDDFEAALVANTNVGGDNCHRGAILGALMGAAYGLRAIPERWIRGLTCHDEIEREIDSFVAQFA